MAKKDMQYDASTVSGFHIYEDEKGRKIYYQPRKLTGYVIQNENVKTYRMLSNRYIISVLAALVLYIAFGEQGLPIWIPLLVGIGAFLLMQYRFHMVFLPNLVQIHNFIPKDKPKMTVAMAEQDAWRLLSKTILYPVFGILLVILFYQRQSDMMAILFGCVVLALCLVYGFINLKAFLYRKSHPVQENQPVVKKNKQKKAK